MKPKYLFLLLLAASVGGAALLYSDDVSFSTSEAAGYAVYIQHVGGERTITVGETVRLTWPYEYRGTSSSPVKVILRTYGFTDGSHEDAVIGENITGRRFRWTANHNCCAGGLPAGHGLKSEFVIAKGQNEIISAPFGMIDPEQVSSAEAQAYNEAYKAQILTLQNQIVALQNENESLQSVIDGLLVQIQQLQAQLINLTQ